MYNNGFEDKVRRALKTQRVASGFSLQEASDALKTYGHPMHMDSISRVENGRRKLSVADVVAFSCIYLCDPLDLFAGKVVLR